MGFFGRLLLVAGAVMLVIVGILLARTFSYGGADAGQRVDLPDPPPISAERAAAHLGEAIRFRTITLTAGDPREGQEGPWLALHDWLEDTYPAAHAAMSKEIIPGGYTLLYTWTGSEPQRPPLLLMAHQDVVPVNIGTEDDWTAPPFAGEIVDGYVYGRGTIDDKGGLVAIMEAMEALATDGYWPRRTVHILFGHDRRHTAAVEHGDTGLRA
ncbi:MAG: M20/M25/M40 family metallo-hydrolase, partial [Pseudomonadota bacterium]